MLEDLFRQSNIDVLNLKRMQYPQDPAHTDEDINYGWCHDWAWIVCNKLPIAHWFSWNGPNGFGHSYVQIGQKFYDAWDHQGVKDWSLLKFWKINEMDPHSGIAKQYYDYDLFVQNKIKRQEWL